MQVMVSHLTKSKRVLLIAVISFILASLFFGHPMAYEKQLEHNIWTKFTKDRDYSLVKQIK